MKWLAGALAIVLLVPATVEAQSTRRFAQPTIPSETVLNQLHLKLSWRTYVPTDGPRDGLRFVQVVGDRLVVQTLSGTVAALDIQDGSTVWRTRLGTAYRPSQPVGYNDRSVFLIQGTRLFALDRKTGHVQWDMNLPNAANAAPAADAESIFVPLGTGRLAAYELPSPGTPVLAGKKVGPPTPDEKKGEPGDRSYAGYGVGGLATSTVGPLSSATDASQTATGPQLQQLWHYLSEARLEGRPALTAESVLMAETDGMITVLSKENGVTRYRFPTEATLSAPVAQHGDVVYIPLQDYNLYALHIPLGKVLWRFTAGGPILRVPHVTDQDLFLGIAGVGLYRLDRASGKELWRNPRAERFLAANPNYVYALDKLGHLLILDHARGRELASYNAGDFNACFANEWTDRLFLGSHDGLIVCLHDRDYRQPVVMKTVVAKKAPKAPRPAPPPEPREEKPKAADKPKPADKPKAEDKPKVEVKPKAKPEDKTPDKPKDKDEMKPPAPKPKAGSPDKDPAKPKDKDGA
jgi:outer membrane protein assembly factor BamB